MKAIYINPEDIIFNLSETMIACWKQTLSENISEALLNPNQDFVNLDQVGNQVIVKMMCSDKFWNEINIETEFMNFIKKAKKRVKWKFYTNLNFERGKNFVKDLSKKYDFINSLKNEKNLDVFKNCIQISTNCNDFFQNSKNIKILFKNGIDVSHNQDDGKYENLYICDTIEQVYETLLFFIKHRKGDKTW